MAMVLDDRTDGFGGRGSELERKAADVLIRYLDSDGKSKALLGQAKVAAGALSTASRNRQTDSARQALSFQIARSIAASPADLAEYVKVTQPAFPLLDGKAGEAR